MALRRTDPQIVVRQEVAALMSNIKAFAVDIAAKRVVIDMEYGNLVNGQFIPVAARQYVIEDKKARLTGVEETLTVSSGRLMLAQTPVANLKVESLSGQVYFEGVNYTRDGNTLIVIAIPNGEQVKTSYSYEEPATFDFSSIAARAVNGGKNLYGNIKDALWEKLLELGLEAGTVE